MSKTLFIIRHAKSSWAEIGARDIDRTLNDRGHTDAPKMAEILRGVGVAPDLIVSSPAKRAFTTAQYFAKAFGIAIKDIDIQQNIYEATTDELLSVVRDLPNKADVILMFGHNPGFTYFANQYTRNYIDNLPTCGIVRLDLASDTWENFNEKTVTMKEMWFPKM
jgi:phosphohistidine phosphatase